jgi:hypothetical protein
MWLSEKKMSESMMILRTIVRLLRLHSINGINDIRLKEV